MQKLVTPSDRVREREELGCGEQRDLKADRPRFRPHLVRVIRGVRVAGSAVVKFFEILTGTLHLRGRLQASLDGSQYVVR